MKLTLHVKKEYFNQIAGGSKTEEYRLFNDYWANRLQNRQYTEIEICLGYPRKDAITRRITFPWAGYSVKTLTHPHFGSEAVKVYAIKLPRSSEHLPEKLRTFAQKLRTFA